jgi:fluoride exporter
LKSKFEDGLLKYLIVFTGSGIGGGVRYWLSSLIHKYASPYFPFGTLIINILGSFLLGWMIFGFDEKDLIDPSFKLFIGIGFCGGFTTFSTFSLETFNLMKNGELLFAGLNILLSVIISLAGIYLVYLITR